MTATKASADSVQLTAFRIGDEEYVVDIHRVREIIRPLPVTAVRHGPKYVKGIINLRGSVIPIVDMRNRFGLEEQESRSQKVLIVLVGGRTLGLVVDQVTDVVRVPRSKIRPAPGLLEGERAPFFMGVCHVDGRALILLNVKGVVESDEDIPLSELAAVMRGTA